MEALSWDNLGAFARAVELDLGEIARRAIDDGVPLVVRDEALTLEGGIIHRARVSSSVYRALQDLAAFGVVPVAGREGVAELWSLDRVESEWEDLVEGPFQRSGEGVIYRLIRPARDEKIRRLLVVLSGVPGSWNMSSPKRYFNYDYGYTEKYRTSDTAILRIADIGGVSGAFYRDTRRTPGNRARVSGFIESMVADLDVSPERVVILGASKGGVGALIHGLHTGLNFIANDPVVSEVYENGGRDEYFLGRDVFERSLAEDVEEALARGRDRRSHGIFFTAPASVHYRNILSVAESVGGPVTVFETSDPSVTKHGQVAGAVLGPTIAMFNCLLHGLPVPLGWIDLSSSERGAIGSNRID